MDNPKAEKVAVVDEVRARFDESDAVIVTEYRGLKVKDLSVLRRSLAPLGGEYRIYKNTLVRIAARDAGGESFATLLTGPTALTFVKGDAAAVTKALREFSRANQLLVVKGGLLGNSVLTSRDTLALADLPSREVLLARLAGGLAAPLQSLAGLLAALPRNFAYGLAALRDKREAAGDTSGAAAAEQAPAVPASSAEAAPAEEAPAAAAAPPAEDPPATAEDPTAEATTDDAPTAEEPTDEAPTDEAPTNGAPAGDTDAGTPNTEEPAEGADEAAPEAGAEHAADPDGAE